MKNIFLLILLLIPGSSAFATFDTIKPPIQRQRFHDLINEEQRLLDIADGEIDKKIRLSNNEAINVAVTNAMLKQIDALQDTIELSDKIPAYSEKVRYLTYLKELVAAFRVNWKLRKIKLANASLLVDNFANIMQLTIAGASMMPLINTAPYEVYSITSAIFKNNIDYRLGKNWVYLKFCALNPEKILQTIAPFVNEAFADSLFAATGKNDPIQLYKYVQDTGSVVGKRLAKNNNPVIKTIVGLAGMQSSLLYFPFLDDIVSGKKKIENLKTIIDEGESGLDDIAYYKLLVQTEMEYNKRLSLGDTAVAFFGHNGLKDMLKQKAMQLFITPINELHESAESIRMKPIDKLSSADIYYMLVMGEDDLYTSSYEKSFIRMIQRMDKRTTMDSFLRQINYDYFKKFIKLAANFNRLDAFLNLMPAESADALMKSFVSGLEISGNLEDAVDVADSYSSITNEKLLLTILNYIEQNRIRCEAAGNNRGKTMYSLLQSILLSANSVNRMDNNGSIGIPSVYSINTKALEDDSGRIVQQVFFFGDGKKIFSDYINSFGAKDWKIDNSNREWVKIRSIKGPEILVYVNRPLNNNENLDDSAQIHLCNYLYRNNIVPSIVVHRGHSYWLPRTMDRMAGNAKIVVLGSCGGYKNFNQLIGLNPGAHIISTKQIGTGLINYNIINLLNRKLLTSTVIDWQKMWNSLSLIFSKQPAYIKEAWTDYVPPYKNLGAIFLNTFNRDTGME